MTLLGLVVQKLAGMTGTAQTEAAEFSNIYGLEVTEVPTNKPLSRTDTPDVVFRSEAGAVILPRICSAHLGWKMTHGSFIHLSIPHQTLLKKMLKFGTLQASGRQL